MVDAKLFAILMVTAVAAGIGLYSTSSSGSTNSMLDVKSGVQWSFDGGFIATNGKDTMYTNAASGDTIEVTEFVGTKQYTYNIVNPASYPARPWSVPDGSDMTADDMYNCQDKILAAKFDCVVTELDAAVAAVEGEFRASEWGMTLDKNENPTFISINEDDGSEGVVSITDISAFTGVIGVGCDPSTDKEAPSCAASSGRVLSEDHTDYRKLGWQETLSNTDWCGAGTDNCNTPCPGTGRGATNDNHCCRRHDHGAMHESVAGGLGVKLECKVDKDLADCSNNWAIQGAFGRWGVAQFWGCSNYARVKSCSWSWRGRRCSYGGYRWETKYGPWRYDSINDRGRSKIYTSKCQTCSGDYF